MSEATIDPKALPRESLDALEALERLLRRHGAVNEAEAQIALRALLPDHPDVTLEEAFAMVKAARPPRPPREEGEKPQRRGRAKEGEEAPATEAAPAAEAPAEAPPAEAPAEPAERPDEPAQ